MPKVSGFKDVPIPEGEGLEQEEPFPEGEDFLDEGGPSDPPLDPQDQESLIKRIKSSESSIRTWGTPWSARLFTMLCL